MARNNTSSSPHDEEVDVLVGPAKGDRGLIGAAKLFGERLQWMQMVVFEVADGSVQLVAQAVVRRPKDWSEGSMTARATGTLQPLPCGAWFDEDLIPDVSVHPLDQFLDLVGDLESSVDDRLSTAVVRSAQTSALESYVRRNVLRGGNRSVVSEVWGDDVTTGDTASRAADERLVRLAELARRYVELLGATSHPKKPLADELHLSVQTIQSYLYKARRAGLLTSAGRGKAGGELTERAVQLLQKGNH